MIPEILLISRVIRVPSEEDEKSYIAHALGLTVSSYLYSPRNNISEAVRFMVIHSYSRVRQVDTEDGEKEMREAPEHRDPVEFGRLEEAVEYLNGLDSRIRGESAGAE